MPSATALETIGRPQRVHRGPGSVCVRTTVQEWQNGIRVPVSSILAQILHGAGNTREARASRIPRICDRTVAPRCVTLRQAYAVRVSNKSEKTLTCHNSCHSAQMKRGPIGLGPHFRGGGFLDSLLLRVTRANLVRAFRHRPRNAAPKVRLPCAFVGALPHTRCKSRRFRSLCG